MLKTYFLENWNMDINLNSWIHQTFLRTLTDFQPMFHFYTPWKHKKTPVFGFFRGYRSGTLVENRLRNIFHVKWRTAIPRMDWIQGQRKTMSTVICKRRQHGLVICSGCHQKHQLHSHLAITSKLLKDLKGRNK